MIENQVHYVYITTHVETNEYYIGRRSTSKRTNQIPELDRYFGSGTWIKSIKDKSLLAKVIIGIYNDFNEASEIERNLIALHKSNPLCKNLKLISSSGIYNKQFTEEHKQKIAISKVGQNNPMWGKQFTVQHRQRMSDNHNQSGENHPSVKLTNSQIIEIKGLLEESNLSQRAIADMFGVKQPTISKIKLGQRWNHLN